jgi:superfamily II DNA or RNA helicase
MTANIARCVLDTDSLNFPKQLGLKALPNIDADCITDETFKTRLRSRLSCIVIEEGRLRINQIRAIQALRDKLQEEDWNMTGYFVQPTGSGKTVLFGSILKALRTNSLILVPKINLLNQTREELSRVCGIGVEEIGLVGDEYREFGRKYTVSTYQSHLANLKSGSKSYKELLANIEVLICDEAHKALGEATQESLNLEEIAESSDLDDRAMEEVMSTAGKGLKKQVLKLAFTATPKLASKSIRKVFGEHEIARETYASMVRAGMIVPFRMFHTEGTIIEGSDYQSGQEMSLEQESRVLERENTYNKLLEMYADLYTESKEPIRAAAFCASIEECDRFMELAEKSYGFKCQRVTSKDEKDALEKAEKRLMNGEIQLIVTVDKLTEGWNFPALNTVIIARASNSPARLYNGKQYGNIIETKWQIGSGVRTEGAISTSGTEGLEKEDEMENSFKAKKALNLMEALLANGEYEEDLGAICVGVDGEAIKYESLASMERAQIKAEILRQVPTAAEWAGMDRKTKEKFKVKGNEASSKGLSLYVIAGRFGVKGDPTRNHKYHLELGRIIYGELPELVDNKLSNEEIKELILGQIPTAAQWADMDQTAKKAFKVKGSDVNSEKLTLLVIAGRFGVEGNPARNHKYHLELGRIIYGELLELSYEEKVKLSNEEIRKLILLQVPTAAEWANMDTTAKKDFKVKGSKVNSEELRVRGIASRFGVEEDPRGNHKYHLELGRIIYGELPELVDNKLSNGKIKELILEKISTGAQWAAMDKTAKKAFKVKGSDVNSEELSLFVIASRFGVEGRPVNNHKYHLELGRIIYGELPELSYEEKVQLSNEEIRELILKQIPTAAEWAAMNTSAKENFKIKRNEASSGELTLRAIARRFGVKGDPASNHKYHLELGRIIYGELSELSYEEKIELSSEEIKELILLQFPKATEWAAMNFKTKKNFKLKGSGVDSEELSLCVIAGRFGVKGDPTRNHKYQLELGRIIYGELPELSYEEKIELSNEEIKELILAKVPTAAEWAAMDKTAKKAFKLKGSDVNSEELSLYVIARRFGVDGDPRGNSKYYLELGRKIYGEVI